MLSNFVMIELVLFAGLPSKGKLMDFLSFDRFVGLVKAFCIPKVDWDNKVLLALACLEDLRLAPCPFLNFDFPNLDGEPNH